MRYIKNSDILMTNLLYPIVLLLIATAPLVLKLVFNQIILV
ncbi:hypothetical protein GCWU000282_00920 [Catonella morbi ATCC 51271]|uniref:Uncharacterized protein n=1 Tax=Catonella morbi ATCC 51271 TaxID=592026 RepID=V2XNL6_9FIRM|nr:hypothetical protein GCWU000282_00920 [Catonella morbi ATCC 51271]